MGALERMPMPWWLRVASALRLARILRRLRYDTRHLPALERPSDDDGLRMLALAVLAKKHRFDLHRLPPTRSVLIEDLAFNALLIVANRALEAVAAELGQDLPEVLLTRFRSAERALEKLWDEETGQYFSPGRGDGRTHQDADDRHLLPPLVANPACVTCRAARATTPRSVAVLAGPPGPERAARRGAVRRSALLEGADLGERQLDHHRGTRRARRNRARRVAPDQEPRARRRRPAATSTSHPSRVKATARTTSPGPPPSPSTCCRAPDEHLPSCAARPQAVGDAASTPRATRRPGTVDRRWFASS